MSASESSAPISQDARVNNETRTTRLASRLDALWRQHHDRILEGAIAILACAALLKLAQESVRLLYDNGPIGAQDLLWYHRAVIRWFAGGDVYSDLGSEYPPASYVLLFPLVGWIDQNQLRWVWEFLYSISLGWLIILIVKESKAEGLRERVLVALIPLAMIGTGVAIGNGQPTPLLVPLILSGILLLQRRQATITDSLVASLCLLFSLIKPSISAPFFWIVLLTPLRIWQIILVGMLYLGLTFFAASFQNADIFSLLSSAFQNGVWTATNRGYANLHWLLTSMHMEGGLALVSLITLGALGAWIFWNRERDLWILLGVTGIIARVWTYHQQYDNLLIVFPLIALIRIAKTDASAQARLIAVGLIAITMAGMLMPARWQFSRSQMVWLVYSAHSLAWLADLAFLLVYAQRTKHPAALIKINASP